MKYLVDDVMEEEVVSSCQTPSNAHLQNIDC
jgi:hypothetical protein